MATTTTTIKKVPCRFCGRYTTMWATQLCDPCWELRHRIRSADPKVLIQIIEETRDDLRLSPVKPSPPFNPETCPLGKFLEGGNQRTAGRGAHFPGQERETRKVLDQLPVEIDKVLERGGRKP